MQNEGGRFVVRLFPFQLGPSQRVRHRAPSQRSVDRMVTTLLRPVRTNAQAEEQVRVALSLLWYWPAAFGPVSDELQRRCGRALRADRLARRRAARLVQQQQHQQQQGSDEEDDEVQAVDADDDDDDLPEPQGPPIALAP